MMVVMIMIMVVRITMMVVIIMMMVVRITMMMLVRIMVMVGMIHHLVDIAMADHPQ